MKDGQFFLVELYREWFTKLVSPAEFPRRHSCYVIKGITLIPRLIWWPFRSLFIQSTIKSYFHASSIELYFIQCICENFLRCFSVYLQTFARITTLEIVNKMHEHINLKNYPLLRHHYINQPWLFPISMNLIDAKLITKGLSIFLRQAN